MFKKTLLASATLAALSLGVAYAADTLTAVKVANAPRLVAGAADPAWAKAKPLAVQLSGGENFKGGATTAKLKAVYTADEAETYFPLGKSNGKWPTTATERETYFEKEWRTWQMSDHLPLFIELRIDFTEKYLKRIREGEQPINPPTPDATDD